MKRSNSYGRRSCSFLSKDIGLINHQTSMVIQQSHLFLYKICTCHGRGVRPFIILSGSLFAHSLHWGVSSSVLLIGTELTPLFHFTPHDCYIWQVYQAVALSVILTVVDVILILRGKSNKVIYSHLHSYSY